MAENNFVVTLRRMTGARKILAISKVFNKAYCAVGIQYIQFFLMLNDAHYTNFRVLNRRVGWENINRYFSFKY